MAPGWVSLKALNPSISPLCSPSCVATIWNRLPDPLKSMWRWGDLNLENQVSPSALLSSWPSLFQLIHGRRHRRFLHERLLPFQRQFRCRTHQMLCHDARVIGIDHRRFRFPFEQVVRVAHEILIQGIFTGNHNHPRLLPAAAHAAAPLEGGHDRPRVPHQKAEIQVTDIDAQFKGAGRYHGQKLSAVQLGLDLTSFLGQETRPVGTDAVGVLPGTAAGPDGNQLGQFSGLGIDNGPQSPWQG